MISIFKGWLFIAISSILLYQMIKRALKKIILTEGKLLSSEQYSRMLFEKSPIGLALTKMDGTFVDVNPAYAAIIGRTIEETLTLGYWDITPQSYGDQEEHQLISLERTGHYGPYEKEYVHKKGHFVPVRLQGSIIEKDGVKYIWSSVEDISERKLSEDLLRKTQKFTQEFMDYSPSVVYAADLDGKIILANKQFETVTGTSANEILGRERKYFLPEAIASEHRANDLQIISSGKSVTFEEENIQHDGKHFYISSKFPLVNNQGEVYAVGGVSTDITQRKMAEEKLRRHEQILRHFIEFSPAAIAMLDRNMNYIIASNRYLSDYRLGNQNIEGRSHYEIFPEMPDRWKEIHERCLKGAVEKCDEDSFLRGDGTIDWVRWEIRPWEESTGEIGGIIIFSEVITERKKTEEALRQSEEKFFKAFQNSPDAVTITRASDGLFVDVNESFYKTSGYTRDEVIGRSSLDLNLWISDTDRDKYVSLLAENGKVTEFDASFRTKSGDIRHFILAGEIFELNGETHILGMIHDVTDRKRAEEELLRTHKQFESTLENMTDGFVALDNNWIYTYVNSRAAKMFGRLPEQLIGKHIWTEFPEGIGQPFYNNYYKAIKTKENINFEEYYEPWGRWYENRVIPSDQGLSIFFQEITARKNSEQTLKESEEKFRKLVDELPNGVLVIDHNGIITGWNHAQEKITGLLSSEVLKKPSWDVQVSLMPGKLITEELRIETKKAILELFERGNSSYLNKPMERTIRRPDGSLCIVESTLFIYTTRDESIAVAISSDITARKLIEEDLTKSHAQLRSLTSHIEKIREEERAQIAREMHDELGQILTSLKMSIAFTRKEIETGNLEMKRENLLREFHTINSTIDTAVEEVRKLITQLRPELLDKLGLLAALEWYTEEFQKSTKIKCSLEAHDKSLALNADKDLAVFRIVQEAMTNIVKYAGAKSVKIFIRREKSKLLVEILDDGIGISEEEIKGEKSFGIMGMRERAMLIGGSLEISGTPGKGTLVRLILGL